MLTHTYPNTKTFKLPKNYYPLSIKIVTQFFKSIAENPLPNNCTHRRIVLLYDYAGSMYCFDEATDIIAKCAKRISGKLPEHCSIESHFYYNCIRGYLYTSKSATEYIELCDFTCSKDCDMLVIFISDAGAARGSNLNARVRATIRDLVKIRHQTNNCKAILLNPVPQERWLGTSAERIARVVHSFHLSEKTLGDVSTFINNPNYKQILGNDDDE